MSKGRSSKKIKDKAVSKWAEIVGNIPASNAATTSAIDWGNIAMPLVKRVFAQTIGLDLVSVQPLSAPIGNLVYMDPSWPTVPPMERLKDILPVWRDGKSDESVAKTIAKILDEIFPGIEDSTVQKALYDDNFMDKIIETNSISQEYGI